MDTDFLIVSEEEAGLRLDTFLNQRFPDYSRTYFQSLIENKLVLVNTELFKKGRRLEIGDEIEVEFVLAPQTTLEAEEIPLDIVYEDQYLLAINKPAGMVVHPAVGNWRGTFVNALLFHLESDAAFKGRIFQDHSLRPGIVHRLDKDTTGLLLAAKDEMTQRKLVEAFALRKVKKEYLAVCLGNPGTQTIEAHIARHPVRRKEMSIQQDKGKEAKTYCETIAYNDRLSVVRLLPFTGRTHQLRLHMQFIGCPILGDNTYGNHSANKKYGLSRQLLHANRLSFFHPYSQKEIELKAPLPQDINQFIMLFNKDPVDL